MSMPIQNFYKTMSRPRQRPYVQRYPVHLPPGFVRDLSLKLHLAFVGCTGQNSNQYLLNQLLLMTYISYFLWDSGFGKTDRAIFNQAANAFDSAVIRATRTGVWRLEDDECGPVRAMLTCHDEQMRVTPAQRYIEAKDRLDAMVEAGRTHTVTDIEIAA